MLNTVNFSLSIKYHIQAVDRDGRIIVNIINTTQCFIMSAKDITENIDLMKHLPKSHSQWLYDMLAVEIMYVDKKLG